MSYKIMRCKVCGRAYHLHSNGKITGAGTGNVPCEHVLEKYSKRRVDAVEVDVKELERYMDGE